MDGPLLGEERVCGRHGWRGSLMIMLSTFMSLCVGVAVCVCVCVCVRESVCVCLCVFEQAFTSVWL